MRRATIPHNHSGHKYKDSFVLKLITERYIYISVQGDIKYRVIEAVLETCLFPSSFQSRTFTHYYPRLFSLESSTYRQRVSCVRAECRKGDTNVKGRPRPKIFSHRPHVARGARVHVLDSVVFCAEKRACSSRHRLCLSNPPCTTFLLSFLRLVSLSSRVTLSLIHI